MAAGVAANGADVPYRIQLIVVRHGQTEWNILGKLQGSEVDTHLNAFGTEQSVHTGHALAPALKHAHLLYCSTLTRARQTMRALVRAAHGTGAATKNGADAKAAADADADLNHPLVTYDKRLLEQAMGVLSGQTKAERDQTVAAHKLKYEAYTKAKAAGTLPAGTAEVHADPFVSVQGAETIPVLEQRVREWLADIIAAAKHKAHSLHVHEHKAKRTVRVVCVAHGMLIKHLLLCTLGAVDGDHAHARGDMIGKNEENCHLTVLQYDDAHHTALGGLPAGVHADPNASHKGMHWSQLMRSTNLHLSAHAAETKRAKDAAAVSTADVSAAQARTHAAVTTLYAAVNTGAPDLPAVSHPVASAAVAAAAANGAGAAVAAAAT